MAQLLWSGQKAPDFTLHVTPDQELSLRDLKGKAVILAFYPADWSPVCGDQMAVYNEILPEFRHHNAELLGISVDSAWCHKAFAEQRHIHFPLLADFHPKGAVANAELLGISVDSAWCHKAFAEQRHIHFPLLADFHPKGAVAKAYGAYRESDGFCERALFVIDGDGEIFWSYRSPLAINPGADGILDALERLERSRRQQTRRGEGKVAEKGKADVDTQSASHVG